MSVATPAQAPRRRDPRRRGVWLATVWVAACLMVVAQLGASVHRSLVPHTICAVHGEWMHATHDDLDDLKALDDLTSTSPEPGGQDVPRPRLNAPSPDEHEHEHCASCLDRRDDDRDDTQVAALESSLRRPALPPRAARVEQAIVAVSLRQAPKTSPPRHA